MDFVLSFKPEGVSEHMETMPLFSSMLRFIVHCSHPLAELSSITLKRLSETPLILPGKGFATRKRIDDLCRKHQLELTVGVEMNDVHTIIHTLREGYFFLGNDIDAGGCTGRREPGTNSDTMCRQTDFTGLFVLGTGRLP